jgi:hypothetical protein
MRPIKVIRQSALVLQFFLVTNRANRQISSRKEQKIKYNSSFYKDYNVYE